MYLRTSQKRSRELPGMRWARKTTKTALDSLEMEGLRVTFAKNIRRFKEPEPSLPHGEFLAADCRRYRKPFFKQEQTII
jgi:hypothetical protein